MIAAVIISFIAAAFLFGSALAKVQDISSTEDSSAGPWGVIERESKGRRQHLAPPARRWQSAFMRAEKDPASWHGLVDYIDSIEQRAGATLIAHERPERPDRRYLKARVARLDSILDNELAKNDSSLRQRNSRQGNSRQGTDK